MNELISVIINVYNGEKYINKCIESVLNQTYKNIEIIIVNDGSTDSTLEICKRYNDDRIKIVNQENKGLSISRNVGIENSNGLYLYFIDADDFIDNNVLEYLYNLLKKYKVLIATCNSLDITDYNFSYENKKEFISVLSDKDMIKKILFSENRAGAIWNKLIDKKLFNNIRFENRIINDVTVVYKLMIESKKIVYSNKIMYFYLRQNESITGKNCSERLIDLYKGSIERYEYIKIIYPDFIENDIGLILVIIYLYNFNKEKLKDYLKENNAVNLSKKLFSFKMLISKVSIIIKLKIVLFRISPILYNFLYRKIERR